MDKKNNEKKYRIAIVGPCDIISLFKSFDVDCFDIRNSSEVLSTIEEIKKDKRNQYAIIFVPDIFLKDIDSKNYAKLTEDNFPIITTIPLLKADSVAGALKIRRLTEKAIGSDILK